MNNAGRIVKARRTSDFTQVPNEPLQRPDLSWKAKGLLCYLLSLHDDWVLHLSELPEHSTDGAASTRTAFKELQEAGYILSKKVRQTGSSLYGGWEHIVYDTPQAETAQNKQSTVNAVFVDTAAADATSADAKTTLYSNTNSTKTEHSTKTVEAELWPTFDDFWRLYAYAKEEKKCIDLWKKKDQRTKELIMAHLKDYIPSTPDKKYRKKPYNYLKNDGHNDEIINSSDARRIVGAGTNKNREHLAGLAKGYSERHSGGSSPGGNNRQP